MAVSTRNPNFRSIPWERWATRCELSGPAELKVVCFLFALLVFFKLINTFCYKFDTDEPQHLHVVWGWARGFIQYRDLYDNHMPLFQILFAPIYALLGDRATILLWMRFILLPLGGVVAWATYRIGTLLFSRRVGIWGAILAGFYPGYHFCSLEFRTDNLWAPLWILSVLTLVRYGLTRRSACQAGTLLGLAFAVSMKTTLLLVSVAVAAIFSLWALRPRKLRLPFGELGFRALLFLLTTLLVPGIVILAFVYGGVWPEMRYWVFENNLLPGFRNHPAWWIVVLPLTFPLALAAARLIAQRAPNDVFAERRVFIFLIWAFYAPALWGFWPLVTRQDYLPYQPIAFPLYAAVLLPVADRLGRRFAGPISRTLLGPASVAAGFFVVALLTHPFWANGAKAETDLLRTTLALTKPSDFVMDQKGETVFRQRCFKPVWETLFSQRVRRGLAQDDAPECCIQTRTCVATKEKEMTERATRFVERYFLSVGTKLYVAGGWLIPSPDNPASNTFETAIPADYMIVSADGLAVAGTLDGTAYAGESRALSRGRHEFVLAGGPRPLAVFWTQAVERGFTPFLHRAPPYVGLR